MLDDCDGKKEEKRQQEETRIRNRETEGRRKKTGEIGGEGVSNPVCFWVDQNWLITAWPVNSISCFFSFFFHLFFPRKYTVSQEMKKRALKQCEELVGGVVDLLCGDG